MKESKLLLFLQMASLPPQPRPETSEEEPAEDDSSTSEDASGCEDIEDKTVVDAVERIEDLFCRLGRQSNEDCFPGIAGSRRLLYFWKFFSR